MSGSTDLAVLGIQFGTEGDDQTLDAFNKIIGASENLIAKLNVQVATFGYSKEAMLAYTAAQLGITAETQTLIQTLTELTVAQEQSAIQQQRDLELYKMRSEAAKQLEIDVTNEANAYFAAMNAEIAADEAAEASRTALNAQRMRDTQANLDAEIAAAEAIAAANQAAIDEAEANATVFAAFKIRTMQENRDAAIALLEEQEAAAAKIAEQQAIAEIQWATLSYETRIKQLKQLQAYQASESISNNTTQKAFSNIPQSIQSDAVKTEQEYAAAIAATNAAQIAEAAGAKVAAAEAENVAINMNRATSEVIVLGREFERGNFSKMGGSFTVLAEALGGLLSPLTLIVTAFVVVGAAAVKGATEQEQMNNALIMTANYSGLTEDSMRSLAVAATATTGTIGNAKEAVIQLAASGKFTAEQIGTISTAATEMQITTGQSVQETIKQFEALAVESTGRSAMASEAVTKAAIKQDDTYHFLTLSILENIEALEKEGDMKGASKIATDALAQADHARAEQMVANAGSIVSAWRSVKEAVSEAIDTLGNIGKVATTQDTINELNKEIAMDNDLLNSNSLSAAAFERTQESLAHATVLLTNALATQRGEQALAVAKGQRTQEESEAVHAQFAIRQQDMTLQKKSLGELTVALQDYYMNLNKISVVNPNDPLLNPETVAQTVAAITKAHTPAEQHVDQNPLDTAIQQMSARIAGYKAEADAATQTADTEVSGMAHVNEMELAAKLAAGEFATLKKGWSQDDQDSKIQELEGLAKIADQQKFVEDGAKALSSAQQKATKDISALQGTLEDQSQGVTKVSSSYENAAIQLLKFWGVSQDSAAGQKLITDSQVEDQLKLQATTQATLLTQSAAAVKAGTDAMSAGDELAKYGATGKATALDIANASIAQAQLSTDLDAGVISAVRAAAAVKQIGTAYQALETIYQKDLVIQNDAAEASKIDFIGAEQAKVLAANTAANKILTLQKAAADAGIAAARTAGGEGLVVAEQNYAKFLDLYNKEYALSQQTQQLNFNVAGLTDMATTLTQAGTAATSLGTAFTGVGTALNQMAAAYKEFATIEAAEAKQGQIDVASRLGAYGDMAAAASNYFNVNSRGYGTLQDVSKLFHAAELAMDLYQFVTKMTQITGVTAAKIAGNADGLADDTITAAATDALNVTSTGTAVAAGAAQMFAQSGWGGFAGVAAMAAVMVGLGYAMSAGSASSAPDPNSAAQMQKTQGTGTVFGDATAQSQSIENSMTLLTNNSSQMLPLTSAMLSSLQGIEAAMQGVTNIILQTQGITDGSNLGISTGKTLSTIGSSIMSSAVGDLVPSLTNAVTGFLFGSSSSSITDGGLQFGGSVGSLAQGSGVSQYANVQTNTKGAFGGLFGGNSTSDTTDTQAAPSAINQQFALIFQGLQTTLEAAGTALGESSTNVGKAVSDFVLPLTKISLDGLTGTALTNAINTVISGAMDKISTSLFPQMTGFQQVGEGMTQTVIRVATGVENADSALQALGLTAINYTDIINKQGDVATEIERQTMVATQQLGGGVLTGIGNIIQNFTGDAQDLATLWSTLQSEQQQMNDVGLNGASLSQSTITGAGGTSNLTQGLSDFLKDYFTPAQQSATALADLNKQFINLGVAMPNTLAGFQSLVQGIDTSTSSGQQLQGSLINLSGAFYTAITNAQSLESTVNGVSAAQNTLNEQLLQAEGNTTAYTAATRADTLATLSGQELTTQKQIYDATDVQTAITNLSDAYKTETSTLNSTITQFQDFSTSLKAYGTTLVPDSSNPESAYLQDKQIYESTASGAAQGDVTDLGNLQSVAQTFLSASQAYNASNSQYQSDIAEVQKGIAAAAAYSDQQVSQATQQLNIDTEQVNKLTDINASVQTVAQAVQALLAANLQANKDGLITSPGNITTAVTTAAAAAAVTVANTVLPLRTTPTQAQQTTPAANHTEIVAALNNANQTSAQLLAETQATGVKTAALVTVSQAAAQKTIQLQQQQAASLAQLTKLGIKTAVKQKLGIA